jgi:hypothetical protein
MPEATAQVEELDFDESPELDETDTVETTEEAKPAKAAKVPARPPVPEGFIAPVAFAKVLTAKLREMGKIAADAEIPPQMVYSYIKNTAKTDHPLKSYTEGGRNNLLKEDEALEWWLGRDERAAERKAIAAAKAAKKAAKEAAKASEGESADVETAEVEEVE